MVGMYGCILFWLGIAIYLCILYCREHEYRKYKKKYDSFEFSSRLIEDLFDISWKTHLYNGKLWWFNLKQEILIKYDIQKNVIKRVFCTRSEVQNKVEELVKGALEKKGTEDVKKVVRLIEAEIIERERYMRNLSERFNKTLVLVTIGVTILSFVFMGVISWLNIWISLNPSIITTKFFKVIQVNYIPLSIIILAIPIIAFFFPFIGVIFDTRRVNHYVKNREVYLYVLSLAKNYIKDEIL